MLSWIKNIFVHNNDLKFNNSTALSLKVKLMIQLIDPSSYSPYPIADKVLNKINHFSKIKAANSSSVLEIHTDTAQQVMQIEADLLTSIEILTTVATKLAISLSSTNFSLNKNLELNNTNTLYPALNFSTNAESYSLCVSIGMNNADKCMAFYNFFSLFMPHFIALSASSPACYETKLTAFSLKSLSITNHLQFINDWEEFSKLYQTLQRCNVITSLSELNWQIKPNPNLGILEINIYDAPATIAETTAIIAFIHALAHWFEDNSRWVNNHTGIPAWLTIENRQRAILSGLEAKYITDITGSTQPLKTNIINWLDEIQPYILKLNYDKYKQQLLNICNHGNSADRQKKILIATNCINEAIKLGIEEFRLNQIL